MTKFTAIQLRSLNEELRLFIQRELPSEDLMSLGDITTELENMGYHKPSCAVADRKKIGYLKSSMSSRPWDPDSRNQGGLMIGAGKFFKKTFFSDLDDRELKGLVEDWHDIVNQSASFESLTLTESSDVHWAYDKDNYREPANGSRLWDSCMKECTNFMDFYTENGVDVLVLTDQDDTVYGRALLWRGIWCSFLSSSITFVDRIYTYSRDYDHMFLEYIKEKGYVTKEKFWSRDNPDLFMMWSNGDWYYFRSDLEWEVSRSSLEIAEYHECPFVDTLFNWDLNDRSLSNVTSGRFMGDAVLTLNQVNGCTDPDIEDFILTEDEEVIHKDDAVSTRSGVFHRDDSCIVALEGGYYHEDEVVTCAYLDELIPEDRAVYVESLEDYVDESFTRYDYVNNVEEVYENMVFSELHEKHMSLHFAQEYHIPNDTFYVASESVQDWTTLTDIDQSGNTRQVPINNKLTITSDGDVTDVDFTITDDGDIMDVNAVCLYGTVRPIEEVNEVKPQFDYNSLLQEVI